MLNVFNKRFIGLCTILLLIFISFFIVQSCSADSPENIPCPNDDFKKIQLKGECYDFFETHHLGQLNHIGPFWFSSPSSVITLRFRENFELIVDGEVQDLKPPMTIFIFRFHGFCPPPIYYRDITEDKEISVYGFCEEYLCYPDVIEDNLLDSRLFNVSDFVSLGQTAWGVTHNDFNGDGLMDFAVSSATRPWTRSTISIFYNDGDMGFTRDDVYVDDVHDLRYIDDLDSGDFDLDGDIDLMFTYDETVNINGLLWATNGTINLLYNNGDGTFGNETMIVRHCSDVDDIYGRINPVVCPADFDNDGDLDFVVGDNSGKVEFYKNDGTGNFSSAGIIYDYGQLSWGLTSGDFDNDGDIDLIVAAQYDSERWYGRIYLKKNLLVESDGSTCFDEDPGEDIADIDFGLGTCYLDSMDYNGDGLLDFVTGMVGVDVFINDGGSFDDFFVGDLPGQSQNHYVDYLYCGGMTSFDMNLDGREDLITGGVGGMIHFCINNFSQLPPLKPFISGGSLCKYGVEYGYSIYAKDINGDDVFYFVDWDDGNDSGWLGPYASGEEIIVKHTWNDYGGHKIRVLAKDTNGQESYTREYQTLILRGCNRNARVDGIFSLVKNPFYSRIYSSLCRMYTMLYAGESVEKEDSSLVNNVVSVDVSKVGFYFYDKFVYSDGSKSFEWNWNFFKKDD